ncbi:MAG: phage tail tape measure protein, partial [Actinomycetes bacterium]
LTGIGLDQLSQTVTMLHGRLGITAPSLKDTGALMVDLSRHGISGSRGVRVVQSALGTLLGGSKATGKELSALGVHLFNAQGKFIGMGGVISQLSPKLQGLTDQQRLMAESILFGKTAALSMNNTILAGVGAYNASANSVRNTSTVVTAAGLAFGTLKGQLKMIAAGAEDLGIKIGGVLVPMLSKMVGGLMSVATWLGKNKPVMIGVGLAIGTVLVPAIVAWAVSMTAAAVATVVAAAPIIGIGLLVGALAIGIVELWTHWHTVWADIKSWTLAVWRPIQGVFHDIVQVGLYPIRMDIQILRDVWHVVWGQIQSSVATAWGFIKPIFDAITRGVGDVVKGISTVEHLASSIGHGAGGLLGKAEHMFAHGATGGIVTRPTLALIGEAGPEAVIPLSATRGSSPLPGRGGRSSGGSGGSSGGGITVHVTGNTFLGGSPADADQIASHLAAAIQKQLYDRQNFGVPILT